MRNNAEIEIAIESSETTGIYNITGDFTGSIGNAGVIGGSGTLNALINIPGTYDLLVTSDEGCELPLEVEIDANCTLKRILLTPKVFLQGARSSTSMNTNLADNALLPLREPYSDLGYNFVGLGGGETTTTAVLSETGSAAIVDWVVVELRADTSPSTIVESRAALLRADGKVVEVDGVSPLAFNSAIGSSYYVAIRHRNHLSVMTQDAIGF